MKPSVAPGLTFTRRIDVDVPRTIAFMGEAGRVYATPALINDIEHTCRDNLLDHLDPGEDSVGTRVEIDHLAATPPGMTVEITVTLTELAGRSATFDVTARDPLDQIARGRHTRFIVDTGRTIARLRAKAAQAQASADRGDGP
jgi:predicted thioesterase